MFPTRIRPRLDEKAPEPGFQFLRMKFKGFPGVKRFPEGPNDLVCPMTWFVQYLVSRGLTGDLLGGTGGIHANQEGIIW